MRVEVLTSLYPGLARPHEGIFAERRWVGMKARGHEVHVTHPLPRTGPFARGTWAEIRRMPRHETRHGIEIDRPRYLHLPGRARRNAAVFARTGFKALRGRPRPDVVVADYAWPAAAVAPLLEEESIPCVISGRGSDVLQVVGEAGLGRELASYLRTAGHWCAVSQQLVDVMDEFGGASGRGVLVPNGVDWQTFAIRARGPAREELGLPAAGKVVLVVGHWIPRKDPLLALDAFLAGVPGDGLCVFIGRGPLEEDLRRRAEELGAGERVRLVGEVEPDELAVWYAACDALLLTSKREGRPNVVLEALACGRPVVATDVGGTGELLPSLRARCLAQGREPAHLGSLLAALLADPPPPEGLRASVAGLSWEKSAEALEGCLEAAIAAVAAR